MQYILEFEWRSDNGPRRVGPFDTGLLAELHVQSLAGNVPDFEAEWSAVPLYAPGEEREGSRESRGR